MRNKILPDLLVYILSPIIVLSMANVVDIRYFAIGLVPLISIYSIIVRTKYNRINLSGIVFSFLYIIFFIISKIFKQGMIHTYITHTYLIISAIIIVLISLFNKNIIKQVYIDILKCKGMSPLRYGTRLRNQKIYITLIKLIIYLYYRYYQLYL